MGIIIKGTSIKNANINATGAPAPAPSPSPMPNAVLTMDPANYNVEADTVPDSSGNGNTLNLNGGGYVGNNGGIVGWGPTSYGTMDSSSSLSSVSVNGFSIATWVNFVTLGSGSHPIIECTMDDSWGWRVDSNNTLNLVKYNVADETVSISPLNTGTWYLLVAAMGPTGVDYYVNGVYVGTYNNSSAMNAPTNSSLTFAYSGYYNGYSNLNMGVVNIYASTLDSGNVVTLFNQDCTRYGYSPI